LFRAEESLLTRELYYIVLTLVELCNIEIGNINLAKASISTQVAQELIIMNRAMSIENVNVRCVSNCLETEKTQVPHVVLS
jgi:predicted aspartyl protease